MREPGENAEAVEAYEKAIRLGSSMPSVCYGCMGDAYERLESSRERLVCFEKAKELGLAPESAEST